MFSIHPFDARTWLVHSFHNSGIYLCVMILGFWFYWNVVPARNSNSPICRQKRVYFWITVFFHLHRAHQSASWNATQTMKTFKRISKFCFFCLLTSFSFAVLGMSTPDMKQGEEDRMSEIQTQNIKQTVKRLQRALAFIHNLIFCCFVFQIICLLFHCS